MSAVALAAVAKRFGSTVVLTDIELSVPDGSLTAILGASGSGKTTLLRLVAGFEQVDAGSVSIGGRVVDDGSRFVAPQHRGVGYVPQDGALFPHLTVLGNVGFGLDRRDRGSVGDLLDLVGLAGLGDRYPHQLSGGQQQRVALARALAIGPQVVLMDEPFSSLDASLRAEVRRDVARILADTGTTAVLVTHDQDEALAMADQIAVLDSGRMIAVSDPRGLYRDPPDLATASSVGEANLIPATFHGGRAETALGAIQLRADDAQPPDGPGLVLLRPEQVSLHPLEQEGATATVVEIQFHGHDALASLTLDGDHQTLLARVPGDQELATGQRVSFRIHGVGRGWASS